MGGCGGQVQSGICGQDPPLQAAQSRARLDAQLRVQHPAGGRELGQCVSLPPALVQRQHQLLAEPLPEWVLADQPGQLGHYLTGLAEREQHIDALLDDAEPQLAQPDPFHLGPRPGQPGQRDALPQAQRRVQRPGRRGQIGGPHRDAVRQAAIGQLPVQLRGVQLPGIQPEQIARPAGRQDVAGRPAGPARFQHPAQPGDVDVHAVHGAGRRLVAPQPVDQLVARYRPPSPHGQHAEHRAPPRAAQRELVLTTPGPHRAEQLNPDRVPVPAHPCPLTTAVARPCGHAGQRE